MEMFLLVLFGILLFVVHFFSDELYIKKKLHRFKVKSLTAGITLAYIFLHLFPYSRTSSLYPEFFFAAFMIGYIIFNLIDRHIYTEDSVQEKRKELREEHTMIFIIYNLFIGISLVSEINRSYYEGFLLFTPLFLHNLFNEAALRELHDIIKSNIILKFILSLVPIFGMIIAFTLPMPNTIYLIVIGLVGGILLYSLSSGLLPSRHNYRQRNPLYFLAGIILMSLLFLSGLII